MGGKGSLARLGKAINPTATGSGGVVLTLDGFRPSHRSVRSRGSRAGSATTSPGRSPRGER